MSASVTLTPATVNSLSANIDGNGCASAEKPARMPLRAAIARPMVATTIGIRPNLSSGSAMPRLNAQPRIATATRQVATKASGNGKPIAPKPSIMKAGSMTNSPCAKLIVPLACQSSVNPSAASE